MEFWLILIGAIILAILINAGKNAQAEQAPSGTVKTVMVKGNMTTDNEVQRYTQRGWDLVNTTGVGRKKVVLTFKKR